MQNGKAYILGIGAQIIWAGSVIFSKDALTLFTPLTIVSMRFVLSVAFMLLIGSLVAHFRPSSALALGRIDRSDIPLFVLAGFLQPFLYFVFEIFAIKLISSPTMAEAVLSTNPLFSPLFAYVLSHEKIRLNNIAGILISSAGVAVILLVGNKDFSIGSVWGVVFAFLAVFSAVTYSTLLRRVPAKYNNLTWVCYVQMFGLVFFLPTWGVIDARSVVASVDDILSSPLLHNALIDMLYIGVLASVCAFVMFCYTIRELGVTRANVFNNFAPVFTALMMLVFYDERLPLIKWAGIAVVIVGLCICQMNVSEIRKKRR